MSDINKVILAALAIMLVLASFVSFFVIVPALINYHNDGRLILAVVLIFATIAADYLAGRKLWRIAIVLKE